MIFSLSFSFRDKYVVPPSIAHIIFLIRRRRTKDVWLKFRLTARLWKCLWQSFFF